MEIAIITGQSFKKILAGLCENLKEKVSQRKGKNLRYLQRLFRQKHYGIGVDYADGYNKQVKDMPKYSVIPSAMLREFTDTFLDGYTVEELEKAINSKILISRGGESLVGIISELTAERDNTKKKRGNL